MYIPGEFKQEDIEAIGSFLQKNSFGILLTPDGDDIYNSQIPFIIKRESTTFTLYGHLARNNEQWKVSENKKATVLFPGTHHYISPIWYTVESSVPTWDYEIVKLKGTFEILNRKETAELLIELSEEFDPAWAALKKENEKYYQKMVEEIVGFRIKADQVQAKWKMSQNRPISDVKKVIDNLKKINSPHANETAREIEESNASRLKKE